MAIFLTVGYGDQAGYERTDEAVRAAAHAHDDRLRANGATIGIAGTPVQVRNPGATGITTTGGPYLRSDLPIAGFALIEADSIDNAIEMCAQTPCAVAHGVVEIWPLLH